MDNIERGLEVASEAALAAGSVLEDLFRSGNLAISYNDPANLADVSTRADLEAEQAAASVIARAFPGALIVGEEQYGVADTSGSIPAGAKVHHDKTTGNWLKPGGVERQVSADYWLIDGLDGTNNYQHGLPIFCTSIAFVRGDRPLIGVCYAPTLDNLFRAADGFGTTINGQHCLVSRRTHLDAALIGTDSPQYIEPGPFSIVRLGSPILAQAFVAAGWLDAYVYAQQEGVRQRMGPWDVAAGKVLVEQAGGAVGRYGNVPFDIWRRGIVATASEELTRILADRVSATLVAHGHALA